MTDEQTGVPSDQELRVEEIERDLPVKAPIEIPFNIAGEQEKTRAWLARALVIIFGSTIGGIFLFIIILFLSSPQENRETIKDLLTLLITSEIGIIGSGIGFYFGSQSTKK